MAHRPSHSQSLLPNPDSLILDRIKRDADRFLFMVSVMQKPARPICGEVIHGENNAAASSARVAITALTGSAGPIPNSMPSITRPRKLSQMEPLSRISRSRQVCERPIGGWRRCT